jgi:hypothetical protein
MWLHGKIVLSEHLVITNVFRKPPTPLSYMIISIGPKPIFLKKTFQWSSYYSKVFKDIFKKSFECSRPRVFGSTKGLLKGFVANQQASMSRV